MYTIGYDFNDTIIRLDGLQFSIRMFTEKNVYSPDPDALYIEENNNFVRLKATGLSWAGNQQKADGEINLKITREIDGRFVISARGKHKNEICKSILIQIYGINVTSIEFDQNKTVGFEKNRDIKSRRYPHDIKMPLAFVKDRHDYLWFALSKDDKLQPKAFASHYDPFIQTQVLDLSHERDKRYRSNEIILPDWHIGLCDDKEAIILERCNDLEENFGLVPFEKRLDTPEWLKDIKLVVNLHGEHWTGHVFNTFADMEKILEWVTDRIDGRHVLVFLPGWDGRYYYNYPLYKPSERMGGEKGLKKLVKKAHELGVKVVPMLGANNANNEVMSQLGMENVAIRDSWGHEKWCDWVDWDYDLFTENNSMLANIGNPKFQKHIVDRSDYLISNFGFDGLFLDITYWYENDPNFSPYEGLVEWAKKIKKLHPDLMLFGENSYDALWGVFSLFHEREFPAGHGFSLYRYAMQTHYLAYPAPGLGSGGIHEYAWDENGPAWERDIQELIPTLSVVGDTISQNAKAAEYLIEKAKSWNPLYPSV